VLDRVPVNEISDLLQWRMLKVKQKENADAQIFHSMAAFAPAFGMVGTLLGLINMLNVMTSQGFDQVASSMGIALITTFYGIVLANLIFKPIAIKLEQRTEKRLMLMNMVLEGIILLGQRRTPAFIRETLKSFITHYEDEIMESPQEPELASGEERSTGSPPQANAAVNQ
ncbi:MAG: chemotaxis protein MotA, partial [Gammaproteobacteria bacterium]|nr:chemotaxis protein MotA [Gammaproteobacteria bacterium]